MARPLSSNPITLDPAESDSNNNWMSHAQRTMIATNDALKDSLYHETPTAGVSSTQIDQSPHNFAWPIREVTRPVANYQNVHTEYRDNYHEWGSGMVRIAIDLI